MSTEQKIFIRKMWLIFVTAVIIELVAGLAFGMGVVNKDHFQVRSNSKEIIRIEGGMLNYVDKDNFMTYMKLLDDKNDLLENALIDLREYSVNENKEFREELRCINKNIADIMMNYSQRGGGKLESRLLDEP